MRKPDFFIVGAPKCGTSSMHSYLSSHPEIFMPGQKEPHYFGRDHHRLNHRPRSEEQYFALFAAAEGHKAVGEASTSYLHSKTAANEIQEFSPSSKIIIMLRDPVEVMYAYHSTMLSGGFEFIADFEAALAAERERKQGRCLPHVRPGILENLFYREVVSYTTQIQRYLKVFGSDRVHIIIFDDFKRDPRAVYGKTLLFLGVCPDFQPDFEIVNPNPRPRSVALNNFLWNPPGPVQRSVQATIPYVARRRLVDWLKRYNVKVRPRPSMNPELKRRLKAEFRSELERLSDLLGRDLTHWSKNHALVGRDQQGPARREQSSSSPDVQ